MAVDIPGVEYWEPVEVLGRERFPDHYAGLTLVRGGIEIHRKPCEELDLAARALRVGVRLIFRDVAYSARELQAVADRITRDHAYWWARGVAIHTWGRRPDLGAVEVTTTDPETARRLIPRRYGSAPPILVEEGGPVVPA